MNLKFHVQHDQTPGLPNCKIRGSKMAADTKKTLQNGVIYLVEILYGILLGPCRLVISKYVAKLGHSNRLKIYIDPSKITSTLAFKCV